MSFEAVDGGPSAALPTVVGFRIRVHQCDRLADTGPYPVRLLRAYLTSDGDPGDVVPVQTDLQFAQAVLDYVADRCMDGE